MVILARRVEHSFDVPVQRSHHANSREHRGPVLFGSRHQRLDSQPAIPAARFLPLAGQ
jgi:hypothetical protein